MTDFRLLDMESVTPSLRCSADSSNSSPRNGTQTPATSASDVDFEQDVAVVGMACRVAGGIDSPEKLWQAIMGKVDASSEIPSMRWEPYYRRDVRNAKVLEKTTKRGYFVEGLENFDAAFFGISPKEAEQMDPQQRLSLEVAWEALESAGIPPQSLSGSDTAVFMGVNSDDYSKLLLEDLPGVEAWMGIGTAYCGVPNRISYQLNLMGPSTAVDAACASSLVAIHHGRLAILQGESRIAIAGGVNALCGPGLTSVLDKAGATSSEGRCRSFDDSANGYGRGEGAAVVVLKNMTDAMADGDNILAVLKGTAVAQDGRTNGIMAPNAKAQELVARKALEVAKTDPLTVGYVEAHATSTPLGDPTEVSAISAVYGRGRPSTDPCFIGSVKPNIGHLEAGAGVMGFIKAVMVVRAGILAPQANLEKVNSRIKWDESGVKVVQEAQDWPGSDHPRRAAICSYGYGGTVSHAVIEQHATAMGLDHRHESGERGPQILLLSSPQEKRLVGLASSHASWIASTGKEHSLASIASTLSTRRGHHDYRVAIVADDHEDAEKSLKLFGQGKGTEWTTSARVVGGSKGVVWVFSGHGAQWADMGKELMKDAIFHNAVSPLDSIIEAECGFSALGLLETGDFESSVEVQVLTYLMQVGLISVLRSKGLRPGAVIGHSVGEIAASVASGCLTAEEGALVVAKRANLYRQMMGSGAMVLVNRPFAEMQADFSDRSDLTAAIDSSPSSCVVSGEKDAVEAFAEAFKSTGSKAFRVKTDIAFHHPMLERLVEPLAIALEGNICPRPPKLPLYSTAMEDARSTALRGVAYWTTNMVQPVRLTAAVTAALDDGYSLFLEVSTNPILAHSINETAMDRGVDDFAIASTMARNKPASKTILYSIAQLHCRGASIDWDRQVSEDWATDVPVTAWSHKPFWRKIETGPLSIQSVHDVDKHTLLGQAVDIAGDETTLFSTKIDEQTKPFPGSHPLHGSEIVPAAVLVNTFLHATGARALSNMVLRVPVAVSQPRDIQVVVKKGGVKICSRLVKGQDSDSGDMSWLSHTTASWASDHGLGGQRMDVDAIKARIGTRLADDFSIDYLRKVGVSAMGFPWAIAEHFGNLKEMIARVDVAPSLPADSPLAWDPHSWAPILDAATSVGSTIFFDDPRLRMPAHIDAVDVLTRQPPPKTGYLYVERPSHDVFAVHVDVLDDEGTVLARFRSMRFSEIEGTPGVSGSVESLVHQLAWVPATYTENPLPVGHVVLISRDSERSGRYEQSLRGRVKSVVKLSCAEELGHAAGEVLTGQDTIITYVPGGVADAGSIPAASQSFVMELLEIVKFVASASLSAKIFVLTDGVSLSADATALSQSPLHGLARIVASEQPELWGGLIDLESKTVPLELFKYVQGVDIIRVSDGIPREARLRPLARDRLMSAAQSNLKTLLPHPGGTYLITGGLGALGLEVADFLVEQGARRLVLVSRRPLPPRRQWPETVAASGPLAAALERIMLLESRGATVHAVAVDISSASAESELSGALAELSLPPVCGVVHAAGVLEDQLVLSTTANSFERVLAPKITGALVLDALFPVGTLDFMMLFSSCGQLFGFPGQASYASGNAFLDSLATHRRALGDNTVALQWTSWRGLGMAASTDFINAELHAKGITDVTRDEAFRAWMHVSKYDTDHGVVLRSLALEADEPLPSAILVDIAVRKAAATAADGSTAPAAKASGIPESGPDRRAYLDARIRECVAKVLHMGSGDEVDSKAPLSDLGVDSVMTVTLRAQLQKTFGVKVPPTLTWSCPTVSLLGEWFMGQLDK